MSYLASMTALAAKTVTSQTGPGWDGPYETVSDALGMGLQTAAVGLIIVFAVLIILILVLKGMEKIFYKKPEPKEELAVQSVAEEPAMAEPETAEEEDVNEEELIAVLTAAVAASLNTSTYHLQIKSYRRIEPKSPAWNRAGLRETIHNRF